MKPTSTSIEVGFIFYPKSSYRLLSHFLPDFELSQTLRNNATIAVPVKVIIKASILADTIQLLDDREDEESSEQANHHQGAPYHWQ